MIEKPTAPGSDRTSVVKLARREGFSPASIWRWMLHGVRGHRLRSLRIGGRRFILEQDWADFCAALNADLDIAPEQAALTAATRAERSGHELDGLLGSSASHRKANA